MRRRCAAGCVTLGLLLISAAAGHEVVPLTRGTQNHLVARGAVNGQPASFLIDTGANTTFLRADRAVEFGVRRTGAKQRTGGGAFPTGTVEEIRLGKVRLGGSRVAIYEAAQLRGQVPGARGKAADGVIGLDILRRERAVINCRTRELFLPAPGSPRLNLAATTGALGFTRIPLTENRRGYLTVPCSIRGRGGRLVVDTGAFVTGLNKDAVAALGLERQASRLTTRGFDGRVRPVELAQVQDLKIGPVAVAPQPLAVMELFAPRKGRRPYTGLGRIEYHAPLQVPREGPLFGLLGNELLDKHRAIIDLGGMSLFLR